MLAEADRQAGRQAMGWPSVPAAQVVSVASSTYQRCSKRKAAVLDHYMGRNNMLLLLLQRQSNPSHTDYMSKDEIDKVQPVEANVN